jgi:predicted Zn finger-like uncharacterized protein
MLIAKQEHVRFMDHRITQCPRCGTSFRVTEAHLAVAAGAVRCGSCLHIFNARDHWADAAPAAPAKPEKPIAAKRIEEIEVDDDALFDDDTALFDDDEPEAAKTSGGSIFNPADEDFGIIDDGSPEEFSEKFLDINSWEEDSGNSFSNERDTTDITAENELSEQAWAQKILEEDDDKTESALGAPARSDVFDDFDSVLDAVPEIDESESHSESKSHIQELADSGEFSSEFLNLDADYSAKPIESARSAHSIADEEIVLESMRSESVENNAAERPLFALRNLEQEPLRLHQFVHESRWPKILWGIGLIAALAVSGWQYIYFNLDDLAHGSVRPWLMQACDKLGCVLPPQFDIAQIRTNSLIVRSHPSQRGALAVDAIITNQAEFPQPYPTLQLQFADLNGAPVAGRRFQPDEYLSGELTGSRLMPVRQPVHIALELLDPGPRAVNYLLTVVASEQEAVQ